MDWFTAYTNNAQEAANDKNTARKKTVAVDLDDSDKQYLRALFNRIAGEDKKNCHFWNFFISLPNIFNTDLITCSTNLVKENFSSSIKYIFF